MCGVAGYWDFRADSSNDELRAIVDGMAASLTHRGPDDSGVWIDARAGLAMGHRRLSIIDLSSAGRQPMVSADGKAVLVYNGEVYNAVQLRAELEQKGHTFRGHSDTEVVLHACREWGVQATVKRLIGMFAFVLWDAQEQVLTLVRDRLGIKPLYWGKFGSLLLFGSELKALRAHPGWTPAIDHDALAAYLRHCYVPAPHSIYRGVSKLEPGCLVRVDRHGAMQKIRYWDLLEINHSHRPGAGDPSVHEATEALHELLSDAVSRRMIADVSLGAFLSGGIDSSTVVALMQAQSDRPVRSFSIGFTDASYDEAQHAKMVAAHIGTQHTELYIDHNQGLEVIPQLAQCYDEPFADASQIPTHLVSQLTRQHITVALSGDGGDEVFAGYNRYLWAERIWRGVGWMPLGGRRLASRLLRVLSPAKWNTLARGIPQGLRARHFGDQVHKLARTIEAGGRDALYRCLISQWQDPDDIVLSGREPSGILWDDNLHTGAPSFIQRMRLLDCLTYLPDDILTKVDRASMAVSLEARVPLLDHRIVEFAMRLPQHLLIRHGQSKWLLRQVLYRYVPRELVERPKMGFGVPIGAWLRDSLREWAEHLLSPRRLEQQGFFAPAPIQNAWKEHLRGSGNWQYPLWTVLMFQTWYEQWG